MTDTKSLAGYTKVYEGYASEAFEVYPLWMQVGKDNIKIQDEEYGVSLHVPNEFINWSHFRDTGEYVPWTEKVKRGRDKSKLKPDSEATPVED